MFYGKQFIFCNAKRRLVFVVFQDGGCTCPGDVSKAFGKICFLSSFENLIFSLFLALYRLVIIAQWFIFIREHQRFSLLGVV